MADKKKNTEVKQSNTALLACICVAAIALLTYVVYLPSLDNGFTNWDDNFYVTDNPLVVINSVPVVKIFETPVSGNYHPLTILSLALNYQYGKLDPAGYHEINLILHVLNTMLVFLFIFLLTRRNLLMAAIVALFFGIHPMHVESVAWISERKDVLYVFFFLMGLVTYLRYCETKKMGWYIVTFLLFILSCLSKGMAVVFPVILLLIDYLNGAKWGRRLLLDKVPFFILSLVFGFIAVKTQRSALTILAVKNLTIFQRLLFASYGAIQYIVKLFVPYKLMAFYSYPATTGSGFPLIFYLSPFILLVILAAIIYLYLKKEKEIVFGLLFYFVSVALVLQFVAVGPAIMADRYSYLSYIGLLFIAAYLINKAWQSKNGIWAKMKYPFIVIAIIGAVAFSFQAYSRTQVWKDSITLWTDAIDNSTNTSLAYKTRGDYYSTINDTINAIGDYNNAVKIDTDYAEAYNHRGLLYLKNGKMNLAMKDFNKAIAIDSNDASAYSDRGFLYFRRGENDSAFADCNKAITCDSTFPRYYYNRGVFYKTINQYEKAVNDFTTGIKLYPQSIELYYNMRGICYGSLQRYNEAAADFSQAIKAKPTVADYWLNRSVTEKQLGQIEMAKSDSLKGQQLQMR